MTCATYSYLTLHTTRSRQSPYFTMAENIPPPDNTRGVPYYEKLKRDLRETLQKKRLLDKNMVFYPSDYPQHAYPPDLSLPRPLSRTKSSATKPPTSKRRVRAT